VTRLAFLSPEAPQLRVLEVRGGVPDGSIPLGPQRALLVGDAAAGIELDRYRVYDLSAALVAIEVEGEELMRRLTELDLGALPAVGAVARGVTAVIERRGGGRFRILVPQELAQYVSDVVADAAEGLA
jgi:sarcosine oxidase gamma subunit